jgi:hypothetical protein
MRYERLYMVIFVQYSHKNYTVGKYYTICNSYNSIFQILPHAALEGYICLWIVVALGKEEVRGTTGNGS